MAGVEEQVPSSLVLRWQVKRVQVESKSSYTFVTTKDGAK